MANAAPDIPPEAGFIDIEKLAPIGRAKIF
jgi:hypothetical protein